MSAGHEPKDGLLTMPHDTVSVIERLATTIQQ
jgi:hypothetical protein